MLYRFHVGDEVVIRSSRFNGRHGIVKELQRAMVYQLEVAGVEELLFFSEQSLEQPEKPR